MARLLYLKHVIEDKGGWRIFYHQGVAVEREATTQIFIGKDRQYNRRFLQMCFRSPSRRHWLPARTAHGRQADSDPPEYQGRDVNAPGLSKRLRTLLGRFRYALMRAPAGSYQGANCSAILQRFRAISTSQSPSAIHSFVTPPGALT